MPKHLFQAICVSMIGFCAAAAAQVAAPDLSTLDLEDLTKVEIFSASKHLQKSIEAPASTMVITRDEILEYGYRTLGEVLGSVTGFYVNYDRNYSYVGVRGFSQPGDYNTRILVLLNGYRLNDAIYNQAPIGTEFPVDLELIDRIEIVRGPGSALYGTSAFFAVVNVITRSARQVEGVELSGEGGSQRRLKGRAGWGHTFSNNVSLLLSASGLSSQGQSRLYFPEFDTAATNRGIATYSDADRYRQIFAEAAWKNFTFDVGYSHRFKNIPTASWDAVFNDPRFRTLDESVFSSLRYERKLGDNWNLHSRLEYGSYQYRESNPQLVDDASVVMVDNGKARTLRTVADLSKPVGARQRLTFGGEYRRNLQQDQRLYDENPFTLYLDDQRASSEWGLYVQDEIQLSSMVMLNAGIRHDRSYGNTNSTSPRISLIVKPWPTTAVKALYGEAFRAPNAYELHYFDAQKQAGNLKPEKIRTFETILEHYVGRRFRVSIAGFRSEVNGLISQASIENPAASDEDLERIYYRNLTNSNSYGTEFELEGKWAPGWHVRFGYILQKSTVDGGTDPANSPRNLAKLNFRVPVIRNRLALAVNSRYTGRRGTIGGSTVGGVPVSDITLSSTQFGEHTRLSFSLYNVLGRKFSDPASEEHSQVAIPQDGRTFRVKLTRRF